MGSGEHIGSNERYIVYREGIWGCMGNENDSTVANGLVHPLRISSVPGSIPDLPSYGSGLEC